MATEMRPVNVRGFEHYLVSSDGVVFSTRTGGPYPRPLTQPRPRRCVVDKKGHLQITLNGGKRDVRKRFSVHRLVALTFIGPPPTPRHEVRHLDGVHSHNVVGNLAWGTAAQNAEDKVRHGRSARGERNHTAKLTASDVRLIRRLVATGERPSDLAHRFGVKERHIQRIHQRETWAWLA